jgi:hypothetical protein
MRCLDYPCRRGTYLYCRHGMGHLEAQGTARHNLVEDVRTRCTPYLDGQSLPLQKEISGVDGFVHRALLGCLVGWYRGTRQRDGRSDRTRPFWSPKVSTGSASPETRSRDIELFFPPRTTVSCSIKIIILPA